MEFRTQIAIPAGSTPEQVAHRLAQALERYRVVHILGAPAGESPLDAWEKVQKLLGNVDLRGEDPLTCVRFEETWSDIRYDPNDKSRAYRHSNTTQPFHTDGSYHPDPPNVNFFFCETQAKEGGETLFFDGVKLVEILSQKHPSLLKSLERVPIYFQKGENPGQHIAVIKYDAQGPWLDWNENRIAPGQGENIERIAAEFRSFLREYLTDDDNVFPLRLAAGEAVMFHERRVLHGRRSFSGDRCLWALFLHFEPWRLASSARG